MLNSWYNVVVIVTSSGKSRRLA